MSIGNLSEQELAEKCAEVLMQRDKASRHLKMAIESVHPGSVILSMPVQDFMIQGVGTCHGGYIFALADSAFAFSCNTYNAVTVAQGCNIEYINPGKPGDTLTAKCREIVRRKHTGVYDVTVENQKGDVIALMRGKSYQLSTTLLS